MNRIGCALLAVLLLSQAAAAQYVQQGLKLVGVGTTGHAFQGNSVAISADGNTAIVGGPLDPPSGAAWVFTRSGSVWSQQGGKLVGAAAVGFSGQGSAVAISADGNTTIIGGPWDNANVGAVWVFTNNGGVWSQLGDKLIGSGAVGAAAQGDSVALSADGSAAIVGGPWDSSNVGAAWVFTRVGGVWSQRGGKLVGGAAAGAAWQGRSVAISADGNTAVIGGEVDNAWVGAAWVFTSGGGAWTQQGTKLVGSGAIGSAAQGGAVAISGDGNTVIVGGAGDNAGRGAAWVFSRIGGLWSQQGEKLTGMDAIGAAAQGSAVTVSGNGNTTIVGGRSDHGSQGAAWVYKRTGDAWSQQGSKLVGTGATGGANQGSSVAISANGNTVIVGGPNDDCVCDPGPGEILGSGAAWVFTASSFNVWVPVASHKAGLNQSRWRSDLGLLNTSTARADAQITYFGSDALVSSTTYVPAGTQSVLTDIVGQLGAGGSGAIGILSDQPLKVTARTYNQVPPTATCYPNGTQGQDYPAVVTGNGLAAGQSAYLAGLVENASYRSNIGVVNTGNEVAAVLVELYDGAGTKLADYPVSLPVGRWAQETQPFMNKAGQTAMDRGYARVTVQTGSGVFAFASVIDNLTNDPTTVAMQR